MGTPVCAKFSFFAIFFETIYFEEKFAEIGFLNSKEGFGWKLFENVNIFIMKI